MRFTNNSAMAMFWVGIASGDASVQRVWTIPAEVAAAQVRVQCGGSAGRVRAQAQLQAPYWNSSGPSRPAMRISSAALRSPSASSSYSLISSSNSFFRKLSPAYWLSITCRARARIDAHVRAASPASRARSGCGAPVLPRTRIHLVLLAELGGLRLHAAMPPDPAPQSQHRPTTPPATARPYGTRPPRRPRRQQRREHRRGAGHGYDSENRVSEPRWRRGKAGINLYRCEFTPKFTRMGVQGVYLGPLSLEF